jgi:hypothetical protein
MLVHAVAVLFLLLAALPARADYWTNIGIPRDPDFFIYYDVEVQELPPPKPMPDLAKRPKPRDSRTLFGAFAPDPQGTLRYYTVGGPRTSTCIGEPVSALCAIETLNAAWLYGDRRLMEFAYGPFAKFFWINPQFKPKGFTKIYRVYDVKQIGPDDLKGPRPWEGSAWYPRWFEPRQAWQVGDLQIQILSMLCEKPGAADCDRRAAPDTYTVRMIAPDRWVIVNVYHPAY